MRRILALLICSFASSAYAQEAVKVGTGTAYLSKPSSVAGAAVLLPGSGGWVPDDFLVRNQAALTAHEIVTLGLPFGINVGAAVNYMKQFGRPVVPVAISQGAVRAADALAHGAQPDAVVFASGVLMLGSDQPSAVRSLGSPDRLPPTLLVADQADACAKTSPANIKSFQQWSGGRAQITWIEGGQGTGDAWGATAAHGFAGVDKQAVGAIAQFILAR